MNDSTFSYARSTFTCFQMLPTGNEMHVSSRQYVIILYLSLDSNLAEVVNVK
jgi:hypothetical protein